MREILKKEEVAKVRLNLALQVTAKTADAELIKKSKPKNEIMTSRMSFEPPPWVGQRAGVARALIEKGADPRAKNSKGQSALDLVKDPDVKSALMNTSRLSLLKNPAVETKGTEFKAIGVRQMKFLTSPVEIFDDCCSCDSDLGVDVLC